MATPDLTTYTGLIEGAQQWLNRYDLADQVPAFIQMAEAQFNRELRTRDMMVRSEAVSQMEFLPVPADFLQEYSLTFNTVGRTGLPELTYVGKLEADRMKSEQSLGQATYYTIINGVFELIPSPNANTDLILTYYARIPRLGEMVGTPPAARQTNWLSVKSPDLYLAATLLQAAPYLNDDSRTQVWATARGELMNRILLEDERAMRSTTQLTSRARAF